MEVLEPGTREVDNSLRLVTHPAGYRMVTRGGLTVATESNDDWAREAKFAAEIPPAGDLEIAVIGGGMCILPRLLYGRNVTVYEIEPALERFCPTTFLAGDYRRTLRGTYDVIVYDVGDEPDRELLNAHLAPGGLLLGVD